jgi:hypothetical protein
MFRLIFSAVALAGVLATAHPAFADPVAVRASEQAQAAAPAPDNAAPPAPVSSTSGAAAPASAGRDGNAVPVGFGWG